MRRILISIGILLSSFLYGQEDSLVAQRNREQFEKYMSLSYDEQFQLEERKGFTEKSIQMAKLLNDPIKTINARTRYVYILSQEGQYSKAFEVFEKVNEISDSIGYQSTDDWRRKAFFLNVEGILYKELGIYDKSLNAYFASLSISDSLDWKTGQATALNNISNLYYLQGNNKQAIQLQKKSLEIAHQANDLSKIYDACFNLMVMYADVLPIDSAFHYAQKTKEIVPQLKSQYQDCFFYMEYANLFLKVEDLEKAKSYYLKTLDIAHENHFTELQLNANKGLGIIAKNENRLEEAEQYLNQAFILSDSILIPKLKVDVMFELSKFYEKKKDTKQAFNYLKQAHALQDSINNSWKSIQQSEMHQIYQLQWQEQENKLLEKNLSIAKLQLYQRNFMLLGTFIILLILIWLLSALYRKRKIEKRMSQQMQKQSQTIQEQEKLIHKQSEEQLKLDLNAKSRQLATYSLSTIKHVQATEEIITKISQLIYNQPVKAATKKELEQVIQQMKRNLMKSDWEEFKTYYEQVHPSFYENLIAKHPDLSANEEKLCAFISLGLSTKDIAALTFRQLRSVESARLRLRKKLGIDVSDSLFDYIKQF